MHSQLQEKLQILVFLLKPFLSLILLVNQQNIL